MSSGSVMYGFVSGFVSAALMFLGSWFLWVSKRQKTELQADSIRDLAHFGRHLRKPRHCRRSR